MGIYGTRFLAVFVAAFAAGSAAANPPELVQAEEAYVASIMDSSSLTPLSEGASLPLKKETAKVVFLWASWCPYCEMARKDLESMKGRLKQLPLEFVSVSTEKSREEAQAHVQATKGTMPAFYYNGKAQHPPTIRGYPAIALLDKKGKLVAVYTGYQKERMASMEKKVRWLLKEEQE